MLSLPMDSDTLRDFAIRTVLETTEVIAALKEERAEAIRFRQFERAALLYAQIAERLWPENPTFRIVGGCSPYIRY